MSSIQGSIGILIYRLIFLNQLQRFWINCMTVYPKIYQQYVSFGKFVTCITKIKFRSDIPSYAIYLTFNIVDALHF